VPVKSGKNIDLGTPIRPLEEDTREILQNMANGFHARFKQVVTQSRPQVDPNLASTFDGRIFSAPQALDRKLIDGIGYLDDAVAMGRELGHACDAHVVFYHRCEDRARSLYAVTPNVPLQTGLMPLSLPGFDRSKLPGFLYMWQPEPTMEKLVGH